MSGPTCRGSKRGLMAGLRVLTLLALAAMLIEPVLISSQRETIKSHLAIILDDSESMKFSDPYTDQSKAAEIASKMKLESAGGRSSVERLRETPRLGLVKHGLQGEPGGPRPGPRGLPVRPRVGGPAGLRRIGAQAHARRHPAQPRRSRRWATRFTACSRAIAGSRWPGLVIASDGTVERRRRTAASDRGGRPAEHPDLCDRRRGGRGAAECPPGGGRGQPGRVRSRPARRWRSWSRRAGCATPRPRSCSNSESMKMSGRPSANQRVVLGEDGILKRTTFRITPKVVGQYEFRAKVEDAGPELTQEDNVATAAVKVVRQQIRVLLIAGSPSPEVQFLRNALMRDQRVEFAGWLQHADPGFRQPGDRPISRLPNDSAELRNYDALLLVDPDLRALGPQWPEMITHFVGQEGGRRDLRGGRALLAAALRGRRRARCAGGELDARSCRSCATPACSAPRPRCGSRASQPTRWSSRPEGRGDPVFEFNADPIRNRSILTSLPGMYWSFPVTRSRPGATVLARHGDPRMQNQYGRQPLLASQLYGPGRTVFIGFDSTYRWRYLSEDYFDGFWARLVDRVGRNKALGGRFPFTVHLGKSVYRVGDQVSVGVRYTDPAALAEATELAADLEIAGQPPEPLRFEKAADDPGLLTASFPAAQAGAYTIRIVPTTAATAGSDIRASTTTFRVEPPKREIDEPSLNRPLLTELARLTGGRVFEIADLQPARRRDPDARGDANPGNARRAVGRAALLRDDRDRA